MLDTQWTHQTGTGGDACTQMRSPVVAETAAPSPVPGPVSARRGQWIGFPLSAAIPHEKPDGEGASGLGADGADTWRTRQFRCAHFDEALICRAAFDALTRQALSATLCPTATPGPLGCPRWPLDRSGELVANLHGVFPRALTAAVFDLHVLGQGRLSVRRVVVVAYPGSKPRRPGWMVGHLEWREVAA